MNSESLDKLAAEDKALEQKQDSAVLALMEHRWKAIKGHGHSLRSYAEAIGRSHVTVRQYANAWVLWQDRGVRNIPNTPVDALVLAKLSAERADATIAVAEAHGVTVGTVNGDPGYREMVRAKLEPNRQPPPSIRVGKLSDGEMIVAREPAPEPDPAAQRQRYFEGARAAINIARTSVLSVVERGLSDKQEAAIRDDLAVLLRDFAAATSTPDWDAEFGPLLKEEN